VGVAFSKILCYVHGTAGVFMTKKKTIAERKAEDKPKRVVPRMATAMDAKGIYDVWKKQYKYELSHLPAPNPDHAMLWITRTIVEGVVMVADMNGQIVGSIGGKPAVWPWNNHQSFFYGEWFCFLPEYSEAGAGSWLLNKMKSLAGVDGVDMLFTNLSNDVTTEKERLLTSEGFVDCGGVFFIKARRSSELPEKVTLQ
jgi:hypothetical protein